MPTSVWPILSDLKASRHNVKLVYHYHVPKTGGTSIFSNLLGSPIWIPFNTDQDPGMLASKIDDFSAAHGSHTGLKLFGRSHNNAKTIANLKANQVYDYAFSFYRDPLAIQVSNMNMIVERVVGLQSGRIHSESEVGRWASTWVGLLDLPEHASPDRIVESLAVSEEYLSRYSSILSRYFPVGAGELPEWLRAHKMVVLDMGILDDFQASVFGVVSPSKSNQSGQKLFHAAMLSDSFRERLLGDDVSIGESLRHFMIDRMDDERLQALMSYANN